MATKMYPTNTTTTVTDPTPRFDESVQRLLSLTQGSSVASLADATIGSLRTAAPPTDGTWPDNTTPTHGWSSAFVFDTTSVRDADYWLSNELAAVTISAAPTANVRAAESNAMANYVVTVYIFKVSADGSTATMIATGINTTELGTTEAARSITTTLAPSSVALVDGDRIGVVFAWEGTGTSASGYTATGYYNGAAGATGDTYVTFTETVTEYTAVASVPRSSPYPQLLAH